MCIAKCAKQLSSGKNSLKRLSSFTENEQQKPAVNGSRQNNNAFCTLELLLAISLARLSLIFDFMALWTDQLLLSKPLWTAGFRRWARLQPRIAITNGLQMFICILSLWKFLFLFLGSHCPQTSFGSSYAALLCRFSLSLIVNNTKSNCRFSQSRQ